MESKTYVLEKMKEVGFGQQKVCRKQRRNWMALPLSTGKLTSLILIRTSTSI